MNYKILMVDDDRELLKMLNQYFTLKSYTVMIAENGIEAMEKISANPDIILLDVNMPGMDGIEVCRRIRDMVSCPIIFLTAKVEEQDRVMGLLSGGDDYVLKPFSLKELDARIIAHLKREERLHRKKEQRFYGELVIDYASKCVHIKGNALELTKLEYEIIEFLSMNPEMVFDKERIYEKIGGYDAEGDSRVVVVILSVIRAVVFTYEIGLSIEPPFAILTAVFCADTYVQEITSNRSEVQRLYQIKKRIYSIIQRLMIQGTFLLLLAVLGYGLFFAFQKPITHPVTESEILQFITCFGAIVVTIFFWGILANTLSMLFRNMWMGIGSSLLIWVATNSTGGDKLFGAWNLFSYSFRDIENTADITWLYGKGLCICIGLILLLALPKIVRKRG